MSMFEVGHFSVLFVHIFRYVYPSTIPHSEVVDGFISLINFSFGLFFRFLFSHQIVPQ